MAISVVQSAVVLDASSGSFASPAGAGNTVVVAVVTYNLADVTIATTAVTLGGSGTGFTQAASAQAYGGGQTSYAALWYGPTGAGGQTAVAAAVTGGVFSAGNSTGLIIYEIAGLATVSPLDQSAQAAAASGTAISSGTTAATAEPSEIAIGAAYGDNHLTSYDGAYTNLQLGDNPYYGASGYLILSALGTTGYTAVQNASGSWAAVVATFTAIAAGPSAITGGGTVTAAGGKHVSGSSSISAGTGLSAPGVSSLPRILQQVTGTTTYDYGWSTTGLTTTEGSTLICFAGWDLNAAGATSALMPAAYVCDSAGNYWVHAGTSSASLTGSRCAVWVCANALPVEWISCSLTTYACSLAYLIAEIANGPSLVSVDVTAANSAAGVTALTADAGTATAADYAFTVLAAGNAATAIASGPGTGWTALQPVTSGAGSPNSVAVFPYWAQDIAKGADVTAAYTITGAPVPLSAVTVGLTAVPAAPEQPNSNFPVLAVEAGFGFSPGDPSQSPPSWTDITHRVIAGAGGSFVTTTAGRQYELATPEAGEITVSINNNDGAFTPGNTSSPYYPDVVLGTPVRVTAWWDGRWYPVAAGYVERWPQEWPDLPQWGISKMVATDAYAVLNSATMTEALPGDMLIDAPYVLLPCAEEYFTYANGISNYGNLSYITASPAQGLLAANISRVNQRPGMYVDGTAATASTGQSSSLLGDFQTSFGTDSISSAPTAPSSGPGVIYTDPALPSPATSPAGVTAEFWVTISAAVASADLQPTVFQAYGPASAYQTATPQLLVQVLNETGSASLQVTFADGSVFSVPFSVSGTTQQIALVFGPDAASLAVYVNGGLSGTTTLTAAQAGTAWQSVSLGCSGYAYQSRSVVAGNFTMQCFGLYSYQLAQQRLVSHYATGNGGQQGVDASQRIAQILAWTYLGIPRGGQVFFNGVTDGVEQGAAYQLSGQSAASAVNQVVANDQATAYVSPSGALIYVPRWGIYDLSPVAALGDAIDGTEIPYVMGQTFGFDNTYLYNTDAITRQVGPTQSITATATSFTSRSAYFLRSALTQTIQTNSDLDAYDIANWDIAKYAQPEYRIATVTIDASSNPSQAFPAVLQIQQAQLVTVTRRPVGGAVISTKALVQQVAHTIGPAKWQAAYQISPYSLEAGVLETDTPGYSALGSNVLA